MGKLKKRSRSSRHRANPLGAAASTSSKNDENLTKTKILPLINNLSSSSANERSMALGAISVLSEDPKFRRLLLKEKLLKIVMEHSLSDSNSEIIVESFGLLRNFVIEEGYDVAIYLWRQGIWKTIEENFNKAKVSFDSIVDDSKKLSKNETALVFDYIENLLSLVIGLVDSSDDIFNQVFDKIDPLIAFIKYILEYSIDLEKKQLRININLFNSILDFIYDFSSQSTDFINSLDTKYGIKTDILVAIIDDFPTRFNELTKIYIQGINLQLLESKNLLSVTNDSISNIIHSLISNIKDINIEETRSKLITTIDNTSPESLALDKNSTKVKIDARSKFQAIELSIEIITAITEIIAFSDKPSKKQPTYNSDLVSFLTTRIPEILIHLLNHLEFRSRSLTALNNLGWLFNSIEIPIDDWFNVSKTVWNESINVLATNEVEIEDKISLFGILWAILTTFGDEVEVSNDLIKQTIEEFKKVSSIKDQDEDQDLRDEYLTRLIGFLASLAKKQNQIEINLEISTLFMDQLNSLPSTSSKIIVEILDNLYDIYGDGEFDYDEPVFVGRQYLQILIELSPKIKTSMKLIDKNKNPELKLKSEEVFNNLNKFIKYKQSER